MSYIILNTFVNPNVSIQWKNFLNLKIRIGSFLACLMQHNIDCKTLMINGLGFKSSLFQWGA